MGEWNLLLLAPPEGQQDSGKELSIVKMEVRDAAILLGNHPDREGADPQLVPLGGAEAAGFPSDRGGVRVHHFQQ